MTWNAAGMTKWGVFFSVGGGGVYSNKKLDRGEVIRFLTT